MRESDLMMSRRRFLLTSVKGAAGAAAGLTLGPEVFDYLDRIAPRRVLVAGPSALVAGQSALTDFREILPRLVADGLLALRQQSAMPRLVQRPYRLTRVA